MSKSGESRIIVPREVLLIEIERRCSYNECRARVFQGLTKEEAREYRGFSCEKCERWTEDFLIERDVPEWWRELQHASFDEYIADDAEFENLNNEFNPR